MKTYVLGVLVLVGILVSSPRTWADHGGGGSASSSSLTSLGERFEPPNSNVFFTFAVDSLDDSLGVVLLYQLQGYYAFTPYFSLGARIPFWSVREDFLPSNDRIGDVALLFKGQVWNSPKRKMALSLGLDIGFPTGNDTESLGAGVVSLIPQLTFNKSFRNDVQFFISVNKTIELGAAINPTLTYETGLQIPVVKGSLPVDFTVAFQGNTWIASDTFINGSTKGYALAGFVLELTDNLEASFIGRISVIDTLRLKTGIPFSDFATGLLSDVRGGFIFNFGYIFK